MTACRGGTARVPFLDASVFFLPPASRVHADPDCHRRSCRCIVPESRSTAPMLALLSLLILVFLRRFGYCYFDSLPDRYYLSWWDFTPRYLEFWQITTSPSNATITAYIMSEDQLEKFDETHNPNGAYTSRVFVHGSGKLDVPSTFYSKGLVYGLVLLNLGNGVTVNITYVRQYDPRHLCSGVLETSRSVCSGRGRCTDKDDCDCSPGYHGSDCEKTDSYSESSELSPTEDIVAYYVVGGVVGGIVCVIVVAVCCVFMIWSCKLCATQEAVKSNIVSYDEPVATMEESTPLSETVPAAAGRNAAASQTHVVVQPRPAAAAAASTSSDPAQVQPLLPVVPAVPPLIGAVGPTDSDSDPDVDV